MIKRYKQYTQTSICHWVIKVTVLHITDSNKRVASLLAVVQRLSLPQLREDKNMTMIKKAKK